MCNCIKECMKLQQINQYTMFHYTRVHDCIQYWIELKTNIVFKKYTQIYKSLVDVIKKNIYVSINKRNNNTL